jgi:hypothetical protein
LLSHLTPEVRDPVRVHSLLDELTPKEKVYMKAMRVPFWPVA